MLCIMGLFLLLSSGSIAVESDDIFHAAENGDITRVKALLLKNPDLANAKKPYGWTTLMFAAGGGKKNMVEFLMSKGSNIYAKDDKGRTATMRAAIGNHKDIVEFFLSKGVDVNEKDYSGQTALILVSLSSGEHRSMAEYLISRGADINIKDVDYGMTALMWAGMFGNKSVVELLISKGADINVKAKNGKTALRFAIDEKQKDTTDLLRKHGAKE